MKKFFFNLLSGSSKVSSKRFNSIWAMALLTSIVVNMILKNNVTDTIIWGLVSIVLGAVVGNGVDKYIENKNNGNDNSSKEDQTT